MPTSLEPIVSFPLHGRWLVINPPGHPPYADDISAIGTKGRLFTASPLRMLAGLGRADQVLGWGRPVYAPAAGEVVSAVDGIPDRIRPIPIVDIPASLLVRPIRAGGDLGALAGNHVLIAFDSMIALLAHLRRGSVTVAAGDWVTEGQLLGAIGNSGNTLAPHLHFHVMDSLDFARAKVLPFRVRRFEYRIGDRWVGAQDRRLPGRLARVRTGPATQAE
jgi:hypothetical protein